MIHESARNTARKVLNLDLSAGEQPPELRDCQRTAALWTLGEIKLMLQSSLKIVNAHFVQWKNSVKSLNIKYFFWLSAVGKS